MPPAPRIDEYRFGHLRVDGRSYSSDLILLPSGVRAGWRRERGHELLPADLDEVLQAAPKILVVGQGAHGQLCVPAQTLTYLEQAGIAPLCAPTARAVEIYNQRRERGEKVAAALHLTC